MAKVTKRCLYCKNEHVVSQSQLDKGWGIFCSRSCKGKYQANKHKRER